MMARFNLFHFSVFGLALATRSNSSGLLRSAVPAVFKRKHDCKAIGSHQGCWLHFLRGDEGRAKQAGENYSVGATVLLRRVLAGDSAQGLAEEIVAPTNRNASNGHSTAKIRRKPHALLPKQMPRLSLWTGPSFPMDRLGHARNISVDMCPRAPQGWSNQGYAPGSIPPWDSLTQSLAYPLAINNIDAKQKEFGGRLVVTQAQRLAHAQTLLVDH